MGCYPTKVERKKTGGDGYCKTQVHADAGFTSAENCRTNSNFPPKKSHAQPSEIGNCKIAFNQRLLKEKFARTRYEFCRVSQPTMN
jgi:hypothetical protein